MPLNWGNIWSFPGSIISYKGFGIIYHHKTETDNKNKNVITGPGCFEIGQYEEGRLQMKYTIPENTYKEEINDLPFQLATKKWLINRAEYLLINHRYEIKELKKFLITKKSKVVHLEQWEGLPTIFPPEMMVCECVKCAINRLMTTA